MEMMGHPGILFAVLLVGGLALLIGELLLPTHGLLGVLGAGLVIAAIAVCFTINQWLGVAVMLAAVGIAPFAAGWAMKIWPKKNGAAGGAGHPASAGGAHRPAWNDAQRPSPHRRGGF
jgi:hypothetical protein